MLPPVCKVPRLRHIEYTLGQGGRDSEAGHADACPSPDYTREVLLCTCYPVLPCMLPSCALLQVQSADVSVQARDSFDMASLSFQPQSQQAAAYILPPYPRQPGGQWGPAKVSAQGAWHLCVGSFVTVSMKHPT
jgi:hypothetical protein